MDKLNYENNKQLMLEKYEWDKVWIENTWDNDSNRVLYIGDSISDDTRKAANKLKKGEILFDGFATSKALDNPFYKKSLSLFIEQLPKIELILFNNGLHGFHLEDESEYARYYEEMVEFLLEKYPNVPLFLLLTTYRRNEEKLKRVKARNEVVLNIAKKYNLHVIDLYTVTEKNKDLLSEDGVHFTIEGYEVIAKEIIKKYNVIHFGGSIYET